MPTASAPARPWHLVPVGLLALIWHAAGALDYVLTQIDYAPYTGQFPPEWMAYFGAIPAWVTALWAIGVWVGLLGAVLLLMREHWAALALAVAFFGMLCATVWLTLLSTPPMQEVVGMDFFYVMIGATVVSLLLWLYARRMRTTGVIL